MEGFRSKEGITKKPLEETPRLMKEVNIVKRKSNRDTKKKERE